MTDEMRPTVQGPPSWPFGRQGTVTAEALEAMVAEHNAMVAALAAAESRTD